MSTALGYYNEQAQTTERLYCALREIKRRLEDGDEFAQKGGGRGNAGRIILREVLPQYGVSTCWTGFARQFDYGKPISPARVAVERHRWQTDEEVRWALRHPHAAALKVGVELGAQTAPQPVKPRKEEPTPRKEPEVTVGVEIRLHDWRFTSGAKGLQLTWMVRDGRAFTTTHTLEPQTYAYIEGVSPDGKACLKRLRLGGSFQNGKLTGVEQRRILCEGRERVAEAYPGMRLETAKETAIKFQYLMR